MPLLILSFIIQLVLVIHILKTGRPQQWIWLVIAVPVIGSIAYFAVELLPSFLNTNKGYKAQKNFQKLINPEKDFNEAMNNYEISDNVKNTKALADECMNKGMYEDAKTLYEKALTGMYKHDPHLLFGLAQASLQLGEYEAVKSKLNLLMEKNPDYENKDSHLLYARALEGLGEDQSALEVYEALETYSPGPEALFSYAMLHRKLGNEEACNGLLQNILRVAKISGKHHNEIFKEWIKLARTELK